MTGDRAPLAGSTLDKYELLEKVGEGGMAEVYRGRHAALGRIVAVKVLHPHLSSTERNRLRFEREARAIESLQHDNILRIFDYSGKDSHTCFIVTEFIEGLTLKELLTREGKLASELAAMVGIELCRALSFAHGRGIIHRDIKPENVMIRTDGAVKLMDFGIARVLDESSMTLTGGLVGSPAYMSPEQACDEELDHRTDIFSLGTLLYRTVTGHLPFTGGSAPVILRNIMEGQFVDPLDLEPGLSYLLSNLISRCLAVEPDERPSNAQALEDELRAVLAQAGVEHDPLQLARCMQDPVGWNQAHVQQLCHQLPKVGQTLLRQGDKVGAMKVFNRVLYLDESNQAVRDEIQKLYEQRAPFRLLAWLTLATLLLPSVGWLVWQYVEGEAQPAPLASREGVLTQALDPAAPPERRPDAQLPPLKVQGAGLVGAGVATGGASSGSAGQVSATAPGRLDDIRVTNKNGEDGPRGVPPPPRTPEPAARSNGGDDKAGASESSRERPGRSTPGEAGRVPVSRLPGALGAERAGTSGTDSSASSNRSSGVEVIPALLAVRSNYQAEIFINGKRYGNTKLQSTPISLLPGKYILKLVNEECEPFETPLTLEAGQIVEQSYNLRLLPSAAEKGPREVDGAHTP
ncbi:MAG: serine/threonine-protein kinase [Myxococcota bacterium]